MSQETSDGNWEGSDDDFTRFHSAAEDVSQNVHLSNDDSEYSSVENEGESGIVYDYNSEIGSISESSDEDNATNKSHENLIENENGEIDYSELDSKKRPIKSTRLAKILPNMQLTNWQERLLIHNRYNKISADKRAEVDLDLLFKLPEISKKPRFVSSYMASVSRLPRKKVSYIGNVKYYEYYKKHTQEVYDFTSPYNKILGSLKGGFISSKGRRLKVGEFSKEGATYWSNHEKDRFFELLARYSIHRSDIIAQHLPKKTEIDVLNYYALLKKETKLAKTKRRYFQKLVTYDEIPIAYEMSEEYVNAEESMAVHVQRYESERSARNARNFSDLHDTQVDQVNSIINQENMKEMTERLYVPLLGFTPELKQKISLEPNVTFYLYEITKSITKKIMTDLVLDKLGQLRDFQRSANLNMKFVDDNPIPLLDISESDVKRAVKQQNFPRGIVDMKKYWNNFSWEACFNGLLVETPDDLEKNKAFGETVSMKLASKSYHERKKLLSNSQDFEVLNSVMANSLRRESKYYDGVYNKYGLLQSHLVKPFNDTTPILDVTDGIIDHSMGFEEAINNAKAVDGLATYADTRRGILGETAKDLPVDEDDFDNEEYSEDEADEEKPFIIGNKSDDSLYFNDLAEKMFLAEAKLTDITDYVESIKQENIFLTYLNTVNDLVKLDDDSVEFMDAAAHDKGRVLYPYMHSPFDKFNAEISKKKWKRTSCLFTEKNDFLLPDLAINGITEDMLFLHSLDFPERSS